MGDARIIDIATGDELLLAASAVAMQRAGQRPRPDEIIGVPGVHRNAAERTNLSPADIRSIRNGLRNGNGEQWSDLVETMLVTDGHLKAIYDTRLVQVSGADLVVEPGNAPPGQEELAALGAEIVREDFEELTPGFSRILDHILHGNGVGWSLLEHRWRRLFDPSRDAWRWHSDPAPIAHRDVDFRDDYRMRIRTYDENGSFKAYVEVPTRRRPREGELDPEKLIVYFGSRAGAPPHLSGDLLACVWPWFFKHNLEVIRQKGLATFAAPIPVFEVPVEVIKDLRQSLSEQARRLAAGQSAVLEKGVVLHAYGPGGLNSGTATGLASEPTEAMKSLDREITKALLGSTDAVEAEQGSYARAKVQASITVTPRFWTDSVEAGACLATQWAARLLRFNAHLTGGVVAPTPRIWFRIDDEAEVPLDTALVELGMPVMWDEARARSGLQPLGGAAGRRLLRAQAKRALPTDAPAEEPQAPADAPEEAAAGARPRLRRPRSRDRVGLPRGARLHR